MHQTPGRVEARRFLLPVTHSRHTAKKQLCEQGNEAQTVPWLVRHPAPDLPEERKDRPALHSLLVGPPAPALFHHRPAETISIIAEHPRRRAAPRLAL